MSVLQRLSRALVQQPLVYDAVQALAGSRRCYDRLRRILPDTADLRVLDVGGGTGLGLAVLHPTTRYVCVDTDQKKLSRLRNNRGAAGAVQASAEAIPARAGGFDMALCVFVCHHLEDAVLRSALSETSRVCCGPTFVMEPLWVPWRPVSRLLWRYDQGANPRTRAELLRALDEHFEVEAVEEFSVLHHYLLAQCRSRINS